MKVFFSRKNTSERKHRASRGFSLMEMLVVIAIIAILVGIAFLAASGLIASMRQNKLDTIAQDIYVAAQDRLTEMYTDNRADAVSYEKLEADGGSTAGMFLLKADDTLCKPKDWDSTIPYAGLNALYNKDAAAAAVLLPKGALSAEVEDNHWIVEYNPEYGYIYGVFYSEKGFDPANISSWYSSNTANKYRVFADRKGSGVGYYGGVGVLGGKVAMTNTSLNVSVNIINAEELRADISVKVPTEFKDRPVRLTLTFTGAQSGVTTDKQIVMTSTDYGYFNRSVEVLMDSFNGNSQRFGEQELFRGMYPGENVTMEVFAEMGAQGAGAFAADTALDTARADGVFNSLFASYDPETQTATVTAGRHLQNLDDATVDSRVDVFYVVQTANIDFKTETEDVEKDEIYWWAESYGERAFTPVTNSEIISMVASGKDGDENYIISGMTVSAADGKPAGMFGTLSSGASITDVSLVGSTVKGTGASGALAGRAGGNVTLNYTGAYLNREDYSNVKYNTASVAVTGSTVGGLIGEVAGNVSATECYAAEILRGGAYAGGLFGKVTGKMELTYSYADCYITANGGNVGGLAGGCGTGSVIDNCYSAGFVKGVPAYSAGFVPSAVALMNNSYSVAHLGPDGSATSVSTMFYATVTSSGKTVNTYYALPEEIPYKDQSENPDNYNIVKVGEEKYYSRLRNSKAASETNLAAGSFRFSSPSGDTTAYNLDDGLGLTNYPYPFILRSNRSALRHYGDWYDNYFIPGTLVYFEVYEDGKWGYYGAGKDYLNHTKTVKRDGYALLYTKASAEGADPFGDEEATVTYAGKQYFLDRIEVGVDVTHTVVRTDNVFSNTSPDGEYYFRELPAKIVNSESAAATRFYTYIKVETPDTAGEENGGISHYYFNPHFAATVVQVESATDEPSLASTAENTVRIRTARQLNLLSRFFDKGHSGALTSKVTLEQERSLNYTSYNWKEAGYDSEVTEQAPIGHGANKFNATYDGKSNFITGISFSSDTLYSGMFGCVGSQGKLRNILLGAEASEKRYVGFSEPLQHANNYAYVGTLAGYNGGTITNCATAGYKLNLSTYNTTLYIGGLVGYNNKSITRCSVENPSIDVSINSANAFVGSFAGFNSGSGVIAGTCSMSSLDVSRFTSGNVRVGGFVGSNAGSISTSYTACAMTASNVPEKDMDGFTLAGGSVQNCYFLTGGTYKFAGKVYAYGQKSQTAKESVGASKLPGQGGVTLVNSNPKKNYFGSVSTGSNCYFKSGMKASTSDLADKYPFESPVTAAGNRIFCGDWITDDIFGNYGMLYWEHEVGGTNEGYHFYLVDENGEDFNTLCTAHDDGGVVTEYGYGYYRLGTLTEEIPGSIVGVDLLSAPRNENAEKDLSGQFGDSYVFTLYNTSDAFADSPDGLYVTGSNAYATLNYAGKDYAFSPFFGAALQQGKAAPTEMQVRSIDQLQFLNWNQGESKTVTKEEYEAVTDSLTYSKVWNKTFYYKSEDGYVSVSMSRKFDWGEYAYYYTLKANEKIIGQGYSNDSVKITLYTKSTTTETVAMGGNTKQLVDDSNYRRFTYLGQTNLPDITGQQVKDDALNKDVFNWVWNQTHDIKLDTSIQTGFTPIAAAGTSSDNSAYNATLYAWFGSTYDGHSYKIEDITITSDAYTVGLFGVTAGAHMMNIIMYSENNARIVRSAPYGNNTLGAYSIGGLIGVAYDYADSSDNHAIENCAIAGYKIIDNSKNQQGRGEANVGGLVGVSNGDLKRCSAVTDIQINCTHRQGNSGGYTQASFGNFIRVGGLTGATLGTVSNCYTGGRITVDKETLKENVTSSGYNSRDGFATEGQISVIGESQHTSTSVYLSGIGGSGFAQNYQNFSGYDNFREGAPTYRNCYTYMEFPKLTGTIRSICAIGGLADRYYYGKGVTIDNCYYLEEYLKPSRILPGDNDQDKPKFYYNDRVKDVIGTLKKKLNGTEMYYYYEMINGTSVCENKLIKNTDIDSKASGTPTSATLAEMTKLENLPSGIWRRVTTVENGATVNGKYSFPGSDHQLDGRNYPFLATVTQDDCTIFVHYGRWPKGEGLFSSRSSITLDLLVEGEDSLDVTLTNYKNYRIDEITNLDAVTFTYSELREDGTVAEKTYSTIVQVEKALADGTVKLTILGLKEGTTTVTAHYDGYETDIQVTVTADFSIEVTPVKVTLDSDGNVTNVDKVEDASKRPEAYQQEDLYWQVSAKNSVGEPISLTEWNWSVEENTVDPNFDEYQFLTAQTEQKQVLLRFRSNAPGTHNVQVTAFDVIGVSGQNVTGTRSREIEFEIKKNPPVVYVFPYPQGTQDNTPIYTLYQNTGAAGVFYSTDKDGKNSIAALKAPDEAPAGYAEFLGYALNEEVGFTNLEDGVHKITYVTPIENDSRSLAVYGKWQPATYTAEFETGYGAVTVVGLTGEAGKYTMSYTTLEGLKLPAVDPTEFVDTAQNRTAVFGGWKVTTAAGSWVVDGRFAAGTVLEPGVYGNVTFQAVWNSRYQITYYQEDDTPYEGVEEIYTSYVGDSAEIRLFTPAAAEGSELSFIGWELKESDEAAAVTGWTAGMLYKDPITGTGFTGNVELVARWGKQYPITYMDGAEVLQEDTYVEGNPYQFRAGPAEKRGFRFDGWKVESVSEGASGWTAGTVYDAGETLDNTNGGYTGAVTLSAQWKEAVYEIKLDIGDGAFPEGVKPVDTIPYTSGQSIQLPSNLVWEEHDFAGWLVTSAEYGDEADCFWKPGYPVERYEIVATETVYGDVTLTAQWSEKTYAIHYNPDGGTMVDVATEDNEYVTRYTKATGATFANATRDGYTLVGWLQVESEEYNNNFASKTPYAAGYTVEGATGDVYVKAEWKLNEYTYTYLKPDGSTIKSGKFSILTEVELHELESLPELTGYTVTGWYVKDTNENGEDVWRLCPKGTKLSDFRRDIVLTYQATPIPYTITYSVDGTETKAEYYITGVTLADAPQMKASNGKARFFTHWEAQFDGNGGGWVNGEHYTAGQVLNAGQYYGDVTLVAKAAPRTLTLYARKAGGFSKEYSVTENYDTSSFEGYFGEGYNPPSRTGWTLDGWFTKDDDSGTKVLNADGTIAANVDGYTSDGKFALTQNQVLYARWKKSAKIFKEDKFPTDGGTIAIGRIDENGLHVLTMTGANNSLGKETITSKNSSGVYRVEIDHSTDSMLWNVSDSYSFKQNGVYLARSRWDLTTRSEKFEWELEGNSICSQGYLSKYYLSISNGGVGLSWEPQSLSFFLIEVVEEVEYD